MGASPDSCAIAPRVVIAKSILSMRDYTLLSLLKNQDIKIQNRRELSAFRTSWLHWLDSISYSSYISYHDAFHAYVSHLTGSVID